jgi:hypothetical protein
MLIQELLPLAGAATVLVEIGGNGTVRELLQPPETVPVRPYDPDDTAGFPPGTVLGAFAGPDPEAHVEPDVLAPALRRLPVGGRVVVLLGWPIEDLPFHTLLGPLGDAGCQVLQAVPLDKASRHGAHCAVIAARVDHLAPLRTYLDDSPITLDGEGPDLRALLRLVGEHTFSDLVARPLRRRLAEQRDRIRQLETELRDREAGPASG